MGSVIFKIEVEVEAVAIFKAYAHEKVSPLILFLVTTQSRICKPCLTVEINIVLTQLMGWTPRKDY